MSPHLPSGWSRMFGRTSRVGSRRRGRSSAARFCPEFDRAEDRILLATLTVTSAADSGPGSLRETVAAAASGDTIAFGRALNGQTIALTSGEIPIGINLDIEGPGPQRLTISGSGSSRVFDVTNPSASVTIGGLSIVNGLATVGGGILDEGGSLTLVNDTLTDDQAVGATRVKPGRAAGSP